MHKVIGVGGVFRDPKVFDKVIKLDIVSSRGKDNAFFFNGTLFASRFNEKAWEYMKKIGKGSQIWFEGYLENSEYEKDGVKKKGIDLILTDVSFVGPKKDGNGEGKPAGSAGEAAPAKGATPEKKDTGDDIPF